MPQTSLKHDLNDNPTLWQMLAITDVISTTTTLTLTCCFWITKLISYQLCFTCRMQVQLPTSQRAVPPHSQEHHLSPLHFQRKQARINLENDNCSEEDFVMRNRHEYSSHEVEINGGRGGGCDELFSLIITSPLPPHIHTNLPLGSIVFPPLLVRYPEQIRLFQSYASGRTILGQV